MNQYNIAVAATGTDFYTHPASPAMAGWIGAMEVIIPTYTNDVTTIVSIERVGGLVVYQSPALNRTTKTEILVERWVQPSDIIRLTLSDAAGGAATVNVILIPRG